MAARADFYEKTRRFGKASLKALAAGTALAAGIVVTLTLATTSALHDEAYQRAIESVKENNYAGVPFRVLRVAADEASFVSSLGNKAAGFDAAMRGSKAFAGMGFVQMTGQCFVVLGENNLNDIHAYIPRTTREDAARMVAYHEASHCQQMAEGIELSGTQEKEIYADVRATLLLVRESPELANPVLITLPLYRDARALSGDRTHDTGAALRKLRTFLEGLDVAHLSNPEITRIAQVLAKGQDEELVPLKISIEQRQLENVPPVKAAARARSAER